LKSQSQQNNEFVTFHERNIDTDRSKLFLVKTKKYLELFINRFTTHQYFKNLDRALSNEDWCQLFPNAKLECLTATSSDHYPLWLVCDPVISFPHRGRQFKFENAWLAEPEFDAFVRDHWRSYSAQDIVSKLDQCASDMMHWSKDNLQNLQKEIDLYHKKIEQTRNHVDASNINYFNALKKRLSSLLI
jgi:hypothetical protein